MKLIEAIILGIVQGLTEFLPVSSSGHLEIGKAILGVELKDNITFTIVVHGATVCSTIVVFYKDIGNLLKGMFSFTWNSSVIYILKLLLSCVPVLILAMLYEERIEQLFTGNLKLVGSMLIFTAVLLIISHYSRSKNKQISFMHSFIIGIAQAIAVVPGISRSGSTIATGLILGNNREEVARFSFLMVLIPIIGKNILNLLSNKMVSEPSQIGPLLAGFFAAFISGWLACKMMIKIVKRSKLIYFAAYCLLVGIIGLILS